MSLLAHKLILKKKTCDLLSNNITSIPNFNFIREDPFHLESKSELELWIKFASFQKK